MQWHSRQHQESARTRAEHKVASAALSAGTRAEHRLVAASVEQMGSAVCYQGVPMRTAKESTPRLLAKAAIARNPKHQKDARQGTTEIGWVSVPRGVEQMGTA